MIRKDREVSDMDMIKKIISKSDVCRISFADHNMPYIVTMNFGYSEEGNGILWFHCANDGRKIEMIRKNNYVCFQMDTDHKLFGGEKGCDWGMSFRSIVGYGNISVIIENEGKIKGLNSIMAHYGGDGVYSYDEKVMNRTTILKLDILEMTGKRK